MNLGKIALATLAILVIAMATGYVDISEFSEKTPNLSIANIKEMTTKATIIKTIPVLKIRTIEGRVGRDGNISQLDIWVSLKSGDKPANLNETILHISDNKGSHNIRYDTRQTPEQNNNPQFFTTSPLIDKGTAFTKNSPLIETGDLIILSINTDNTGLDIRTGTQLSISFITPEGTTRPLVITTNQLTYGTNKIY